MKIVQYILLIFLITTGSGLMAQYPAYRLETFGTRDGLLSSKIYVLSQSEDRQLWIGTELGISVYNGYEFTNQIYTSENEPIGRILAITHDSLTGTWIGGDKGLFYIIRNRMVKIHIRSRPSLAIESLLTDQKGNIWVGELHSLYRIPAADIAGIRENQVVVLDLMPYAGFTKRVFALSADKQENIYASSYDGIFKISTVTPTYATVWSNPDPVSYVRSVAVTSPDSVYWNCLDSHPNELIHSKWKSHTSPHFVGRTVFKRKGKVFALTTDGVAAITYSGLTPLISFAGQTNNAVAALIDEEGNIWVGSWEGLLKYRKSNFNPHRLEHENHSEVFSMLETSTNDLLFGSNRGLVFTKKGGKLVRADHIPKLFNLAEIMCMTESADGSLWFGSGYQGIATLNKGLLRKFTQAPFLKDENCEELYKTREGKLLAATENGITVIDPLLKDPIVDHFPFQKTYARYPELFGSFQGLKYRYYFYGSQGLYTLQEGKIVDDSIDNMPVRALYINKMIRDAKGYTWIATMGKGLLQCTETSQGRLKMINQYNLASGAPSDNALSVIVDKNGYIWWGDYMSLSVLVSPGPHAQIISFNEKDGLLSSYYQTLKLEKQRDGTIWGLTSMGVFSFHPDSIGRNLMPPSLILGPVSGKDGVIPANKAVTLSYKKNSITFNYTAVSLTDPAKIRYGYRLKGLDSNWTYTTGRTVTYNSLQPGTYTFELKASNNNNSWTPLITSYTFTIKPPFWETWWFRTLVVFAVLALIYWLVSRRVKRIRKEAQIKQLLSELEGKALRAQMNPHFIFNSLNAIQELIVTKNFSEGYEYLSRFSKLLRMVLNNSEKNLIPLATELEMIRLYLNLESLRFKQSFHYSINIDQKIDEDTMLVPSLLVQPFIENAIWHGLRQKEGEKKLRINLSEKKEQLVFIIEDNGIGRARSALIKAGKIGAAHFESRGMKLSEQRIEILNEQLKEKLLLQVEDLYEQNGEPAGTRVVITIPIKTTFTKWQA